MKVRLQGGLAAKASKVLQAAHWGSVVAGGFLMAWPLFVYVESAYTQWSGERQLAQASAAAKETVVVPRAPKSPARANQPRRGSVLGRFAVPSLDLSYVVLEGTDNRTLDRSIGHVEGTSGLGTPGNIGIAGHRNTHFRKLEWIRRGDLIVLTTPQGEYRYKVEWMRLFSPTDIQVLDEEHGPAITLVTCFPFEYVGSAPLRYVIRALPDEDTRTRLQMASVSRGRSTEEP
jgi:LPXTG-site transpeptidase (sortase) family protein